MFIGLDMSSASRWEKVIKEHPGQLGRIFTEEEQAHCMKKGRGAAESFAGLWAAREAASKALGTGFSGAAWLDAYVTWNEMDAPVLHLKGVFLKRAKALGINDWALSITHENGMAAAVVVMSK